MITKPFEDYIKNFDYPSIPEMKISSKKLLEELPKGNIQVIDVRFKEEFEMWRSMNFINIPINELPNRLSEIDKTKLIVTVCPGGTRSNLAMLYLKMKGYNTKFLSDGLTSLNSLLLGGDAKKMSNLLNGHI